MKKAAPDYSESSPAQANDSTPTPKRKTKIAAVLELFISGQSLNRFEAERIGDHCLNSTVAALSNNHGITFLRHSETVPNRFGGSTPVTRYQLPESEMERARKLLAHFSRAAP